MNELLAAAKAVIALRGANLGLSDGDFPYLRLRAAVERAERQEVVGFEEWFEPNYKMLAELWTGDCAKTGWNAGVQAERERIRDLLRQSDDWFEEDQMAQAKWLLEMIDAAK